MKKGKLKSFPFLLPLTELGGKCAILAYVGGAEVRIYLKQRLLHIGIAQLGFELVPFSKEETGGAFYAVGDAALLYPQILLP